MRWLVTSCLIRIYNVFHSVFYFWLTSLFAIVDVSKFKDGIVRSETIHWSSIISQYFFWWYMYSLYHWASIAIPDDTPKSIISKENDSFNMFQNHFYNKLRRSKMLLKYTGHLYDKQGHLTQALLHKKEPLRRFWPCFPGWLLWLSWTLVRLEIRRLRFWSQPGLETFFHGDWSWNIFCSHFLPSTDSRRAVVSSWRKNVHKTGFNSLED